MTWAFKRFNELDLKELYDILALRTAIFVVEQDCPYQECDGKDFDSIHVIGRDDQGKLVAYLRILDPGISYEERSIGRVVVDQEARGKAYGKALLKEALDYMTETYGTCPIRISAQAYLIAFYQSFGFEIVSEEYLEDGIPHVEMLKK